MIRYSEAKAIHNKEVETSIADTVLMGTFYGPIFAGQLIGEPMNTVRVVVFSAPTHLKVSG